MALQQIKKDGQCVQALAEYIWLDPKGRLQSRTKVVAVTEAEEGQWVLNPLWASVRWGGEEMILSPCYYIEDPIRGEACFLVLCEVRDSEGRNHRANHRANLRGTLDAGAADLVPAWCFDQPFDLNLYSAKSGRQQGAKGELGPGFVGRMCVGGRATLEEFYRACLQSGLMFRGGQTNEFNEGWSFQMGFKSLEDQEDPKRASLHAGDQLLLARWILRRLFEDEQAKVTFGPLAAEFSTEMMRHLLNGRGMAEKMGEVISDDLAKTSVPLKTQRMGNGPVHVSINLKDPYHFMNHLLLGLKNIETQPLARADQERYKKHGLTLIQGGAKEPSDGPH
jgi:hypothetical protein